MNSKIVQLLEVPDVTAANKFLSEGWELAGVAARGPKRIIYVMAMRAAPQSAPSILDSKALGSH